MKKLTVSLLTLSCLTAWAADPENIYPEGNFESSVELIAPSPSPITTDPMSAQEGTLYIEPGDYENKGLSVGIETEGGTSFVRYVANPGFDGILRTYIPFKLPDPAPGSVTISMRWRLVDFAPAVGAPEWAGAQNDPDFVLADGSRVTLNGTLRLKQDTAGEWVEVEKTVIVPEGAKMIILKPGLYLATGTLDIDDIKVIPE